MKKTLNLLLCLLLLVGCSSMNQTIEGMVFNDETKMPIEGASVYINGNSQKATTTDANGHFSLPSGTDRSIKISATNYQSKELDVDGRTEISVYLVPDSTF